MKHSYSRLLHVTVESKRSKSFVEKLTKESPNLPEKKANLGQGPEKFPLITGLANFLISNFPRATIFLHAAPVSALYGEPHV